MRPTTRRLVSVSVLILGISIVGFILGAIFYWLSQVVLDSSAGHNVTAGNPIQGNVSSIPLPPIIALAVFAFLAPSRRWWGTLAVVVLCLLEVLFTLERWERCSRHPRRTSLGWYSLRPPRYLVS